MQTAHWQRKLDRAPSLAAAFDECVRESNERLTSARERESEPGERTARAAPSSRHALAGGSARVGTAGGHGAYTGQAPQRPRSRLESRGG